MDPRQLSPEAKARRAQALRAEAAEAWRAGRLAECIEKNREAKRLEGESLDDEVLNDLLS